MSGDIQLYLKLNTMNYFNTDFEKKLTSTVQEIETVSKVEVVVVIKQRSASYSFVPMAAALIGLLLFFLFFMLSPIVFGDYMILAGSLAGAVIGYALFSISALQNLVLKRESLDRAVEVKARAIFQKAGIHHTMDETGILVYGSLQEKSVMIVADRGVENLIGESQLNQLEGSLQSSLLTGPEEFLKSLATSSKVFAEHLPVEPDDINELPDYIEIDL